MERVPFRRYVAEVMASGEWPGRLHQATLEVGAVATKQYAWYYAMRGHHRPGYQAGSRCYDVRDDTMDQLYRPERAYPNIDQQRAIDATWALSLRKSGRFFLTGYRAGVSSQCAADANGWKLYARSVEACARQGWTRQRLQRTYLGPNLSFVWSERLGPILAEPEMVLKRGSRLPDSPVTVSWKPLPVSPGVSRYVLQRRVGRGDWTDIPIGAPVARQTRAWLKTGLANHFRVRGVDDHGRLGPWYYSGALTAALRGPVGTRLGGGGLVAAAASSHKWVRSSFTGRSVALVAATGPGMGRVRVFVNGKRVGARRSAPRDEQPARTRVDDELRPGHAPPHRGQCRGSRTTGGLPGLLRAAVAHPGQRASRHRSASNSRARPGRSRSLIGLLWHHPLA